MSRRIFKYMAGVGVILHQYYTLDEIRRLEHEANYLLAAGDFCAARNSSGCVTANTDHVPYHGATVTCEEIAKNLADTERELECVRNWSIPHLLHIAYSCKTWYE